MIAARRRRKPNPTQSSQTLHGDSHAVPATGAMKATASLEPGQYAVDLADDAIVIRANQVNELVLFRGIATTAKFQLFAENFDWKTVSVDIHAKTLQAAVVELLGAYPYEIVYSPDASGQQQVLSEVVIGKPAAAVAEQKDEDRRQHQTRARKHCCISRNSTRWVSNRPTWRNCRTRHRKSGLQRPGKSNPPARTCQP